MPDFQLSSPTVKPDGTLPLDHVFDPDAPTGSGCYANKLASASITARYGR